MAAPTHLLYLHGFRSSPRSAKALRLAAAIAQQHPTVHWCCPQLPPSPRQALDQTLALLSQWPVAGPALIGSSLGGFYATVLAERFGWRAVLLNPAVDPARDLQPCIGETRSWHSSEPHVFAPESIDELRAMRPRAITRPERYFAVIAQGDEVLDWHEMAARYAGCRVKLVEGGDHALSDFDAHLGDVLRFLELAWDEGPPQARSAPFGRPGGH